MMSKETDRATTEKNSNVNLLTTRECGSDKKIPASAPSRQADVLSEHNSCCSLPSSPKDMLVKGLVDSSVAQQSDRVNSDIDKSEPSDQQPLTDILCPHGNDVLCGRGNFVNSHMGNAAFRRLVKQNFNSYMNSSKSEKPLYPLLIYDQIKKLNPPGRFLKQDPETELWNDIGKRKAIDKTRQALREGVPNARLEEERWKGSRERENSMMMGLSREVGADLSYLRNSTGPVNQDVELKRKYEENLIKLAATSRQYDLLSQVAGNLPNSSLLSYPPGLASGNAASASIPHVSPSLNNDVGHQHQIVQRLPLEEQGSNEYEWARFIFRQVNQQQWSAARSYLRSTYFLKKCDIPIIQSLLSLCVSIRAPLDIIELLVSLKQEQILRFGFMEYSKQTIAPREFQHSEIEEPVENVAVTSRMENCSSTPLNGPLTEKSKVGVEALLSMAQQGEGKDAPPASSTISDMVGRSNKVDGVRTEEVLSSCILPSTIRNKKSGNGVAKTQGQRKKNQQTAHSMSPSKLQDKPRNVHVTTMSKRKKRQWDEITHENDFESS